MEQRILEMVADKLNKKVADLSMETRLIEDLGADSLDIVELVMEFEDEFEISLPDEEVAKMKTIGDAVNYIKSIKK